MRNRFSALYALCAAALTAGAALPVQADDTEIYLGAPTASSVESRPNILFVMDTSGSMGTNVTTQTTFDPKQTYTGKCSTSSVYWRSSTAASLGLPVDKNCAFRSGFSTSTAGAIDQSSFFCKTGQDVMDVIGFQTVTGTAQWKPAKKAAQSVWAALLRGVLDQPIECADDSKLKPPHGDGTKAYAGNGTNGPFTDDAAQQISWTISGVNGVYTYYSGNYLNWYYNASTVTKTRLQIVQESLKSILSTLSSVNVGLMRFSTDGEGGMVVKEMEDISTSRDTMVTAIDAMAPSGNTPLSETYSEALRYWRGMKWDYGSRSSPQKSIGTSLSGELYKSPIAASCQKNFIVLLTDGEPVADQLSATRIQEMDPFQAYLDTEAKKTAPSTPVGGGKCTDNPKNAAGISDVNGKCLDDLAGFAHNTDLVTGASATGDQTITTYTVGFGGDVQSITWAIDLLKSTADRGGGSFFTAGDTASLTDAFTNIIEEILSVNTTFTAPTVAVNAFNRTQNLDDLYITVFGTPQPPASGNKYHWPGNIKKYEITTDGTIVGPSKTPGERVPVVEKSTGFFSTTAQSFWSDVVDGPDVTLGGAAHEIPDPADRKVYTDVGGTTLKDHPISTANKDITDAMLGIDATSTTTHDELIEWIRGADVDAALPADQTKPRFVMGDPLHGRPATVIYGGTEADPDLTLFAVTNDGYLHAINTKDGSELWAYVPSPMLRRMDDLHENDAQPAKRYGLDGNIRAYKLDLNNNGIVDGADKVYLFFGMGRGGESYYALDVTDRDNPKVLWRKGSANETQADGTALATTDQLPGLAQTWSTPVITNVNIDGTVRLVAIFAGGYDPSQDNLAYNTDDIGNRIYMLDAVTGEQLWRAGPDTDTTAQLKISTSLIAERQMNNSIPSDVRVIDLNGDQLADRMYVTDTGARVWRFDIRNGDKVDTLVRGGVFASLGRAGGAGVDPTSARRFYYAPDVSMLKQNGSVFLNIAVGTGFRGHPLDEQIHDRFYSLRDKAPFSRPTQAEYDAGAYITDADTNLIDVTTDIKPTIPNTAVGWKMSLNNPAWQGEKVLAEALTFAGTVIFTTYLPQAGDVIEGSNSCVARQGRNRLYAVSAADGSPVLNRDNSADADGNVSKTGDSIQDRWSELNQSGIAPEAVILFPETSVPACIVGVESCGVSFTNDPQRTFWYQRDTEGTN
jgi:type IV pilus assembly protein PilY1